MSTMAIRIRFDAAAAKVERRHHVPAHASTAYVMSSTLAAQRADTDNWLVKLTKCYNKNVVAAASSELEGRPCTSE